MLGTISKWFDGVRKRNYIYANKERAVWHREGGNVSVTSLSVEWYFFKRAKYLTLMLGVDDDHEGTYYFTIGVPFLMCVYFTIDARPNRFTAWFCGKHQARETGFRIGKEFVNLKLHHRRDDWTRGEFNGWQFIKDWSRLFIGDCKQELIDSSASELYADLPPTVNYPKGKLAYRFDISIETVKFHYKRWYMFWYKPTNVSYTVTPTDDIIVNGKRGDEKVYESTIGNVTSKAEAVDVFIARIVRDMDR